MSRQVAVVVNPTAGGGRGGRVGARAVAHLEHAGLGVHRVQGRDSDEAAELAGRAVRDGVDAVVMVGGDGLAHVLLQVLKGTETPLGVIPAGTGNDVARLLGIDRRDTAAAVDVIVAGHTRAVDLADVSGTRVVTVVATGFDSLVNERANGMTWPRGQLRYHIATLLELRVFEPIRYALELDGVPYELDAMLVAVGNGPTYGGGLRICEGALVDDGLLDVVVIKPLSKLELVRVYPRLFSGTHVRHPAYEHHRVRSVSVAAPGIVAYGDGERLGPLPVTVSVVPSAVRVFVPSSIPAAR